MKIALIGPAYPLRGGIADFNEAFATALQENGHEVSIFSFHYQYPSILFPGKTQFSDGPRPQNLNIISSLSSINPLSWFKTARKVGALMPDVVVIRYWLPFMAPALGTVAGRIRSAGIPVIAITDNVIPHEKRPGDRILTKYFVRNCDAFIAMSRSVLGELEEFTSVHLKRFLPHPIYNIFGEKMPKSDARRSLGIGEHDKVVLFFGLIRKYKGLSMLIHAMNDKRLRSMNVKLLVAGEFYEDRNPYLELIRDLGLDGDVILHTEFIEKIRVREYFCAADLVAQPYQHATQSGITQIAYHFARPMLVTNVGGLAEIVAHDRVGYVTEKSPESIANAIYNFYKEGREAEFSSNAAADSERFSWKYFIKGFTELYEEIR